MFARREDGRNVQRGKGIVEEEGEDLGMGLGHGNEQGLTQKANVSMVYV